MNTRHLRLNLPDKRVVPFCLGGDGTGLGVADVDKRGER